jgi:antitoxin MazE
VIDIGLCEVAMRVFKWGNDLAVQIPEELVRALDLKAGDEIDVHFTRMSGSEADRSEVPSTIAREQALERIRALARPLPADWKFDRDEANRR